MDSSTLENILLFGVDQLRRSLVAKWQAAFPAGVSFYRDF